MLEVVILIEALTIVALVTTVVRQQSTLFRAAMSRTPGEYRKLEQAAQRPAPQELKPMIDEATALVLESVTSQDVRSPMPHGLGGD